MRILLDTHIALWAIADSGKLDKNVVKALESAKNEIYYSTASVWEIAIKRLIKPDQMPMDEEEFVRMCDQTGFLQLPVRNEHIFALKTLKRPENAPKHNDPFDRLLLAQAKSEGIQFYTHDSLIPYYGEACIVSL